MFNISMSRKTITYLLLLCWLVGVVFAFWWFQFRDIRPFSGQGTVNVAEFRGHGLESVLREKLMSEYWQVDQKIVTVVNFWAPDCPCSRFNEAHVRELVEKYAVNDVRFVSVVASNQHYDQAVLRQQAQQKLQMPVYVDQANIIKKELGVPSSPAVAIFSKEGKLNYFGPYSAGAFCNDKGQQIAESRIERLLAGDMVESKLQTRAVGCFCEWST